MRQTAVQNVLTWSGGVIRYRLGVEPIFIVDSLVYERILWLSIEAKRMENNISLVRYTTNVLDQLILATSYRAPGINFPAKLIIGVGG